MVHGLLQAEVEFVVIGGVAAVAHGSTIQTNDLDICYRPSPENIERLVQLLKKWNAYPRGWEEGLPFEIDARTLATTPILTLRTSEGFLDLLDRVAGLDGYETVVEQSEEFPALDLRFRALGLAALIRAKEATGRAKDLAQLPVLRALLAMKKQD